MTDTTTIDVPGYKAGTWVLDPAHSEVTFSVRHMMISKVRGTFGMKSATLIAPENPLEAKVEANVDVDLARHEGRRPRRAPALGRLLRRREPTRRWSSSRRVRTSTDGEFFVDGDLTIRGVTKPVSFEFEFGGFGTDPWGNYKAGATAKTVINREDFGLTWNAALETGGVLVGKDVTITLDLQGALQQD